MKQKTDNIAYNSFTIIFIFFCTLQTAKSQELNINFKAINSNIIIDSVQATNLTTNESETLLGNDTLILTNSLTGTTSLKSGRTKIYPNPCNGEAFLNYSIQNDEKTIIKLYNSSGQLISSKQHKSISGNNSAHLQFPQNGLYIITIEMNGQFFNHKIISKQNFVQDISILFTNSTNIPSNEFLTKSTTITKSIYYTNGDIIKYIAYSGLNIRVIVDQPTDSQTYEVEFFECIDNDSKSYKTVVIGDQIWMAENLAYLPSVNPPSSESSTEPYYYVYDYLGTSVSAAKETNNYKTYGVLYNWPAAINACPNGWHLPSDDELKQLEMYIGMSQSEADEIGRRGTDEGKKLKAANGWYSNGNGTDEYGFGALPGGLRDNYYPFYDIGLGSAWWGATDNGWSYACSRYLYFDTPRITRTDDYFAHGLSVRCVRD